MSERFLRLDWDSSFFGVGIGRLAMGRPSDEDIEALTAWMVSANIDCVYALIDSDAQSSIRALERIGASLVDIRLTLDRSLADNPGPLELSPVSDSEVEALAEVARYSHNDSRFYADERFPSERCDDLYGTWLTKSCREEFADAVLVSRSAGRPTGYITCNRDDGVGSISLIAVAEGARGDGLGSKLVEGSLAWFAAEGLSTATVVTQARNTAAIRLYERAGFVVRGSQLWYHLWRQ